MGDLVRVGCGGRGSRLGIGWAVAKVETQALVQIIVIRGRVHGVDVSACSLGRESTVVVNF